MRYPTIAFIYIGRSCRFLSDGHAGNYLSVNGRDDMLNQYRLLNRWVVKLL